MRCPMDSLARVMGNGSLSARAFYASDFGGGCAGGSGCDAHGTHPRGQRVAGCIKMRPDDNRPIVGDANPARRPPAKDVMPHQTGSDELLFMAEVADFLRSGLSTVRHWIATGRLPGVQPGRHLLVWKSDLYAFIARGERERRND